MSIVLFRCLRKASSSIKHSASTSLILRSGFIFHSNKLILSPTKRLFSLEQPDASSWVYGRRWFSYGSVRLVISEGKPKFETEVIDPPKKYKWQTKKRLKLQRMKEKQQRKAGNKRDPRCLNVKGKKKKHRFANAEERIKYKLEKAKLKEAMLIERLKRYEVPKVQGPAVKPHQLTGEERFYLKKMAQKRSNYVQVGRRGVFGGLILNMHMHWKKHETVEIICKPCKPGQVQEFAQEIARLSGGIPIQIIGDDTIIFYRGKDYVQPKEMSPIDTLSKKKALEKSKYEQSLDSVRRFIAISEKELELYYRHIALYGDPNNRNPLSLLDNPSTVPEDEESKNIPSTCETDNSEFSLETFPANLLDEMEAESSDVDSLGNRDDFEGELLPKYESDSQDDTIWGSSDEEAEANLSMVEHGRAANEYEQSENRSDLFV